jgi:hypothetical protein
MVANSTGWRNWEGWSLGDPSWLGWKSIGVDAPSATYADIVADIGSVRAYYNMNETSGVVLDNTEGDATFDHDIVGNPVLGEPGAIAGSTSFEFDRVLDSCFSINNAGILPAALPISFSYFIKRPVGGWLVTDNYYGCYSSRAATNRYMLHYCSAVNQTARFGIRNGGVFVEVVSPVISDTDWHHIALVATPTHLRLAFDGVFVSDVAHAVSTDFSLWANAAVSGFIQGTSVVTSLPFGGNIDQVSIHGLAFTQQNVDDLLAFKV